jgi:hypothetical protein
MNDMLAVHVSTQAGVTEIIHPENFEVHHD